jgi:peptidyl-prolyl cis-trans isomerase C
MNAKIVKIALPLLLSTVLLWGCQNETQDKVAEAGKTEEAIATVNGAPITEQQLQTYMFGRQSAQPDVPPDRQAALNELIKLEVIKQQAEKEGIDKRPLVKAELNWQRTNLLVDTLMRERVSDMSFTEKELKNEYKTQVAKLSKREYKAKHILTKTREEAEKIIEKLNHGADFVKLSEAQSTAPSAPQGGDLGWFSPTTMVPPFAKAVEKLKEGEYTKVPVKTRFGWHVILLEDIRETQPPAYAEVKDRLKNILTSQALDSYINKLRADANVEIKAGSKTPPQTPAGT